MEYYFGMFIYMVMGHFVCDYPLQPDFIAKYKARSASLAAVPWYYVMGGHCAAHGVMVSVISGSVWVGLGEFVAHYLIDVLKCEGKTNIHVDQGLHVICKVVWVVIISSVQS